MAGIAITRRELTATELRAAAGKTKDARATRRMLAIALVVEGVDRATAAQTCGMDRQTLRDWVHRYNAEGLDGLANRKVPHRPRRLVPEQLAELAISSAERSLAFGIEPRVAMLSYSSGTSGAGADVDKVRQATELVRQKRPDLKVEGPIQYDAAVDPLVGRQKLPDSEVAGQASVLIFPDLNTGNNTYKAVQRETGALAIGPVLQGLNKPVNDLSRGCTVDDVFNTVVITAIQSQQG